MRASCQDRLSKSKSIKGFSRSSRHAAPDTLRSDSKQGEPSLVNRKRPTKSQLRTSKGQSSVRIRFDGSLSHALELA